jgi:hypothetical protein
MMKTLPPLIPFYMIANMGTLVLSRFAQTYPRHLILSQVYQLPEAETYRATLKAMRSKGVRIILDNGAYEGHDVGFQEYIDVILDLKPQVIVLPDLVGRNHRKSRACSLDFVEKLEAVLGSKGLTNSLYPREYMYCPQGASKEEVLDEFGYAYAEASYWAIIGVGRCYQLWYDESKDGPDPEVETARIRMLQTLADIPGATRGHVRHHVLGARWNPPPAYAPLQSSGLNIIGLDTFKPVHCALAGVTYPYKPSVKFGDECWQCADEHLLRYNLAELAQLYSLNTRAL